MRSAAGDLSCSSLTPATREAEAALYSRGASSSRSRSRLACPRSPAPYAPRDAPLEAALSFAPPLHRASTAPRPAQG